MGIFSRSIPRDVRDHSHIRAGERIVAFGRTQSGEVLVATERALYLDDTRIPWDLVSRANWVEPVLEVVYQTEPGSSVTAALFTLSEVGQLPTTIRERVTASIVIQERVLLEGNKGALMVARKGSDDNEIRWSVVFDDGLDPHNPVLRQRADEMLAVMRGQFGI